MRPAHFFHHQFDKKILNTEEKLSMANELKEKKVGARIHHEKTWKMNRFV